MMTDRAEIRDGIFDALCDPKVGSQIADLVWYLRQQGVLRDSNQLEILDVISDLQRRAVIEWGIGLPLHLGPTITWPWFHVTEKGHKLLLKHRQRREKERRARAAKESAA